jgi:glycosyltransferase involved in cell wall biosynthesis
MESGRLVSVVIPCYNGGSFLSDAIQSVLGQTYQPTEIIVVDDGSTDNTRDVAMSYPGVRLVRQKNQGVARARNAGLGESRGDYTVFLDADDRLVPDALEIGVTALNSHPECSFVSGGVRVVAQDGSLLQVPDDQYIERDHYLTLLKYCYIWTPSAVMFRNSVLRSVGGFTASLSGAADWDLYLRIARRSPILCHPHLVADYRVHTRNMSGNSSLMLTESLAVLRAQRALGKRRRGFESAYRTGVNAVQSYFGEPLFGKVKSHVRAAEWSQALRGGLILLRYYPRRLLQAAVRILSPAHH